MKKVLILTIVLFGSLAAESHAQQQVVVKSNLLYDATTTMNLGLEIGLARQWTLDIPVNLNPWDFGDDKLRFRHWGVQPEVRYWFNERFRQTFVGIHAHVAEFNMGKWPDWPFISENMQTKRYEGHLYGAGVSVGHSWILNKRWSFEASVGLGYARIVYDKYPCESCGSKLKEGSRNYIGPTKVGLSLIYVIK